MMLLTVTEDKMPAPTVEQQVYVDEPVMVLKSEKLSAVSAARSSAVSKKAILLAVTCLAVTVIVTGAVVGGMYMFTETTKDTVKYTLSYKDSRNTDVKEDITSDHGDNSVQYHVVEEGKEIWVVNDFNTNIQVTRVQSESGVLCYVNALNRTLAQEPMSITAAPAKSNEKEKIGSKQLVYKMSDSPISDVSFLNEKATKLCRNVPTYWVVPHCGEVQDGTPNNSSTDLPSTRHKRALYCGSVYGYNCYCGCNIAVCGCVTGWFNYRVGIYNYCNFYHQTSCPLWIFGSTYSGL